VENEALRLRVRRGRGAAERTRKAWLNFWIEVRPIELHIKQLDRQVWVESIQLEANNNKIPRR